MHSRWLEQVTSSASHSGQSGSSPVVVSPVEVGVVVVPVEVDVSVVDGDSVVAAAVWLVVSSLPPHAGANDETTSAAGTISARVREFDRRGARTAAAR